MPKVCRYNVKVNGRDRQGEIFYTASTKTFHFKFPEEVTNWGKVMHPDKHYLAIAESQSELEDLITNVIEEYEQNLMKERKVIAYKISGESTRQKLKEALAECEDDYDREREIRHARERDESVEIKLEMKILLERTVGDTRRLFAQVEDGHGDLSWEPCTTWCYSEDEWHTIPWSESAEKFFSDFYGGCEELLRRMYAFAGTPEKVKKAIKNSSRLLGGPDVKA